MTDFEYLNQRINHLRNLVYGLCACIFLLTVAIIAAK